jgi:glycosyltransferase involved in cell wall biosynthesis
MLISIIIPCFNEEKVLRNTYARITAAVKNDAGLQYELIFINDGSSDRTQEILQQLSATDPLVNVIKFSRNFGHQPAVTAGIRHCQGTLAVIIDADLQDPPEIIPAMIQEMLRTGSNVVYGVRKKRKGETFFKLVTAKLFTCC